MRKYNNSKPLRWIFPSQNQTADVYRCCGRRLNGRRLHCNVTVFPPSPRLSNYSCLSTLRQHEGIWPQTENAPLLSTRLAPSLSFHLHHLLSHTLLHSFTLLLSSPLQGCHSLAAEISIALSYPFIQSVFHRFLPLLHPRIPSLCPPVSV